VIATGAGSTMTIGDAKLEPRVRELGGELLDAAERHKAGLLSAKFYSDKMMDWTMKDQDFKVQLFRFVDTFPVLRLPDDGARPPAWTT
jgi:RHH-type proline utilization regulon transcriptional repressor/proline dehydrogenase/delta 1-pyrroline-5-carboxylate dehydrogenase